MTELVLSYIKQTVSMSTPNMIYNNELTLNFIKTARE